MPAQAVTTEEAPASADVVVCGAGVIGLGIAWRLAGQGLDVVVVDPAPGSGASWTAAGMLAPVTELHYGEAPLLQLNLASARRYPEFVGELEQASDLDVGYRRCGTVTAAWDGADLADLRALATFAASLGESGELLTGRELRSLVPHLAPGLPGGFYVPDDHQVDNRQLHRALLTAAARSGAVTVPRAVAEIRRSGEAVAGVVLDDGTRISTPRVVLAAGTWSAGLRGLPADLVPPVRPVKGQTLRLRAAADTVPDLVVRAAVRGAPIYVVPRTGGEVVVGASSEEAGFDVSPRAGAVYELLRDAQSVLPGLSEARFVDVSTGLRPGSPDNAPLIGATDIAGLTIATGHYRNGILLTPITAEVVAELVTTGEAPELIRAFAPDRFRAGRRSEVSA